MSSSIAPLRGVSGRDTLGEAATQIGSGIISVQSAREQLYSDLKCP
ncbi:MAG: hypothetical protein ACFBSG_17870 [Leptolyngbyaceae cyanobacterium]